MEKYPKEEWKLISELPQLTGLLMSSAVYSGVEGTRDELKASLNSLYNGLLKYPENNLIINIISNEGSKEKTIKKLRKEQKNFIAKLAINDKVALHYFHESTLEKYKKVGYFLSKRETPVIINEYKRWVFNIAEEVAVAAIEGAFFGKGGELFSKKERDMFEKIKKNLK